jgi:hypothetical protein
MMDSIVVLFFSWADSFYFINKGSNSNLSKECGCCYLDDNILVSDISCLGIC